jgi:hypothetical protein
MVDAKPRPFEFLRHPLYLTGALIIAVYIALVYYVLLMRGVMTPAIHERFGVPVPVAPWPWANVWETPASWINVLNQAGRPGELLFTLAIVLVAATSLLTGVFVSGVLYSKYRGFGAAGTACAAGGSLLVAAGAGCPTCLIPAAAALGVVIPLVSLPLAGVEFLILDFVVMAVLVLWFVRRVRRSLATGVRVGTQS